MKLRVNGSDKEVPDGATVSGLLSSVLDSHKGVAVAVDGEVVPRRDWESAKLSEGQAVEIVRAVQGG